MELNLKNLLAKLTGNNKTQLAKAETRNAVLADIKNTAQEAETKNAAQEAKRRAKLNMLDAYLVIDSIDCKLDGLTNNIDNLKNTDFKSADDLDYAKGIAKECAKHNFDIVETQNDKDAIHKLSLNTLFHEASRILFVESDIVRKKVIPFSSTTSSISGRNDTIVNIIENIDRLLGNHAKSTNISNTSTILEKLIGNKSEATILYQFVMEHRKCNDIYSKQSDLHHQEIHKILPILLKCADTVVKGYSKPKTKFDPKEA